MRRFLRFVYAIVLGIVGLGLLFGGFALLLAGRSPIVRVLGAVMVAGSWGVSRIAYPLSVRLFGPLNPPDD
ncbi:MAG: hypothetical protein ACXVP7_13905 [Actinomycetota bacterium]